MKLKDQVISLKIAKQLKELNIIQQESLFYWIDFKDSAAIIVKANEHIDIMGQDYLIYSAFTVAELSKILPETIKDMTGYKLKLTSRQLENEWAVWYGEKNVFHRTIAYTEANAKGEMLVYLLDNKIFNR